MTDLYERTVLNIDNGYYRAKIILVRSVESNENPPAFERKINDPDTLLYDISVFYKSFIYIDVIEVNEKYRRQKIGSNVMRMAKRAAAQHGVPIFLKAGCISEEEYDAHEDDIMGHIMRTKVPFYESNNFKNINDTCLHRSESVVMCYPPEAGDMIKD